MTNKATFKALKAELEKTVKVAQQSLEQYLTVSHGMADWQSCVDNFNQLRGIFSLLEHRGAALLCEESVQLLQLLPIDAPQDHSAEFDSLTQAIVMVQKYLEFQELGQAPYPEILLPVINRVRRARKTPSLREGCFHRFDYQLPVPAEGVTALDAGTLHNLKKYRHMFQAGLLHVLRGNRARNALRYVALSVGRIEHLLANTPHAGVWTLSAMAAEGMAAVPQDRLPGTRSDWFKQLDRQLRNLLQDPTQTLTTPPSQGWIQEALYYIALTAEFVPRLVEFQQQHPEVRLRYNQKQLDEQIQLMQGPGQSVLQSVSSALQEEFNHIKDIMDQAAVGEPAFSAYALRDLLLRVADTLEMVGLASPANVLRRMWDRVRQWPDNAAPQHTDLMQIADSVLYAEAALARLNQSGQRSTSEDGRAGAQRVYLHQARVAVLDEMESGISVCKRAISAYMDSERDVMHLANVPQTLRGIRGALSFLDGDDAIAVVDHCIAFVQQLQAETVAVTNAQLDSFADALSSLEFFLDGMLTGQKNQDVITLARVSLAQLPR